MRPNCYIIMPDAAYIERIDMAQCGQRLNGMVVSCKCRELYSKKTRFGEGLWNGAM